MKIYKRDDYLKSIGSTYLYDAAFLFVFPLISLLALVGNLISYWILSANYFKKKPLYTYLRVSCLNSSLINLIYAITFICDSRRYLDFSNSEIATYFRCYVKIPVIHTCYFYGSMLDIISAIDRFVEFTRFKQRFRKLNPNMTCVITWIMCALFNLPNVFVFEPKKQKITVQNDNGSLSSEMFYFYGQSLLAFTQLGRLYKYVQFIVYDIFTLLIMLIVNIMAIIMLRYSISLINYRI